MPNLTYAYLAVGYTSWQTPGQYINEAYRHWPDTNSSVWAICYTWLFAELSDWRRYVPCLLTTTTTIVCNGPQLSLAAAQIGRQGSDSACRFAASAAVGQLPVSAPRQPTNKTDATNACCSYCDNHRCFSSPDSPAQKRVLFSIRGIGSLFFLSEFLH